MCLERDRVVSTTVFVSVQGSPSLKTEVLTSLTNIIACAFLSCKERITAVYPNMTRQHIM